MIRTILTLATTLLIVAGCDLEDSPQITVGDDWYLHVEPQKAPEGALKDLYDVIQDPTHRDDVAYDYVNAELSRDSAYWILQNTRVYATPFVGEYFPSPQVQAYRLLADRADAVPVFRSLLRTAQLPGKIYACHALNSLCPTEPELTLADLSTTETDVPFHQCCLQGAGPTSLAELLLEHERGATHASLMHVHEPETTNSR